LKQLLLLIPIIGILTGYFPLQSSFAQELGGGVDLPGEWYVGEGLKRGDQFSYNLCHVDYKECVKFRMDFWIESETTVGTEDKWLVQAVVYDGNKIVKGNIELGKIAPEPTGGSSELIPYRSAFKSSIAWLSAFATSYGGEGGEGPKKFSAPSWGKIGNIGGQQVRPTAIESIIVPDGPYSKTVRVSWHTGGYTSNIWVVDGFPFPIKAKTFTHVSEGKAPTEYEFELLDYKQNVKQNPFSGIVSTSVSQEQSGCSKNYDFVSVKKPTKSFQYQLEVFYGPKNPSKGCNIEWIINFKSKFDETEFLNQVQYDILVVDENLKPLRSIAEDEGRKFLYTPSGQVRMFTKVMENPGTASYVIWIYGLSPQNIVPSGAPDYLKIDIPISSGGSVIIPPPVPTVQIPSWIKNNAGWWADGQIDDNSFVQGIQYMIKEGIMKIPPTSQGPGSGTNQIPSWIKNNAGWWADGQIDDNSFVQGIQYLIQQGIMKIA
jgi:hypothetical protein